MWAKRKHDEGICPICLIKQHFKKSKITISVPNEFYDNGSAQTPPMGWSSWNTFHNNIDEKLILDTADAMVKTGLADAGYRFVNLDDCWQSSSRTEDGKLQGDLTRFPNGIKPLVEKVNHMGLKLGIYSSNGDYTCEDLPASLGHEKEDAETFAEWGVEYFKYDYCHEKKIPSLAPFVECLEIKTSSGLKILTADDAKLHGIAKIRVDKSLQTGKYLCFLGQNKGKASFTVDMENDENCPFTAVFKKRGQYEKYMVVKVNDEYYEMFFPATSAWNPEGRCQINVNFKRGTNKIEIFNPVCTRADSTYIQYKRMGEELKKASNGRKIVYSICEHGKNNPKDWAWNTGNLWRTTPDINAFFPWISIIYTRNLPLSDKGGSGHWNDPDMLEVGNGKLTADENRTHFSLWCMMAAPLILGNDIRELLNDTEKSKTILSIIKNKDMIAINQDSLGKQCIRFKKSKTSDYLIKELSGNRAAICIFNKINKSVNADFSLSDLPAEFDFKPQKVTEIWSEKEYSGSKFTISLPPHASAVFILS